MAPRERYTEALFDELCNDIAAGRSLTSFAKKRKLGVATVLGWPDRSPEHAERYVRAREASADKLADEIVDLADKATAQNHNAVRLKIDARKWVAAKLKPQRYGDKLDLNHSGQIDTRSIPDDRLDARITELLGKAGTTLAPSGAGAATPAPAIVDILPGDGATSAGFVSEAHGILRGGDGASGETDAGS